MSSIQVPTLQDLLVWATGKPQTAPIGLIESETFCPLAGYLHEHDTAGEHMYTVTTEYIDMVSTSGEEERVTLPGDLRLVVRYVDAYGPYAIREEIPAAQFIHILQTVQKEFAIDPTSCE